MIRVCMTKCPGYNLKTGTKLANTQHFLLKYYIYIYTHNITKLMLVSYSNNSDSMFNETRQFLTFYFRDTAKSS